jgi:hypothetical protein
LSNYKEACEGQQLFSKELDSLSQYQRPFLDRLNFEPRTILNAQRIVPSVDGCPKFDELVKSSQSDGTVKSSRCKLSKAKSRPRGRTNLEE